MLDISTHSATLGVASIAFIVVANGFFVAAEFSLVAARRTRLEERAQEGDARAKLALRALDRLDHFISATQLGITLASLGLGWIGEPALAHFIDALVAFLPDTARALVSHGVAVAISFSIITALHILFGELMPQAMALVHPEEIACWLAAPLLAFAWVMALPIRLLNGTSNRLLRSLRINTSGANERLHSPEEIRMLVEQSHEGGSMLKEDARLLQGVFEFSEKTAEEVMTPRTQILALEADLSVEQAADRNVDAEMSRYPVIAGSLDDIVGIVHAKDVLSALRKGGPGVLVGTLMRSPLFVPATKEVEDVLADMKRLKVHMAVVLDEHGGTYGLVTMEDLLEEIVGSILDEYDEAERPIVVGLRESDIDGSLSIKDFNDQQDGEIDDTHYNTIAGFVFGALGRLPRPGDRARVGIFDLEVIAMDGRRIKTLRVHRLAP